MQRIPDKPYYCGVDTLYKVCLYLAAVLQPSDKLPYLLRSCCVFQYDYHFDHPFKNKMTAALWVQSCGLNYISKL